MTSAAEQNLQQREFWNGAMAETWVKEQAFIDAMLAPFQDLIVEELTALRPRSVLDIGCGNGATTLALAKALGDDASVLGVDISEPMVANAKARLPPLLSNASFISGDAATADFGQRQFDAFTSRFGVMFFAEPEKAFAHFRKHAANRARTALVVWRSLEDNPFMAAGPSAAAPLLPPQPARDEGAPGAFSLADPRRIHLVLAAAGWREIRLRPVDLPCRFPLADLDMFIEKLAPIGADLPSLDETLRTEVLTSVRAAFTPFIREDTVRFTASAWLIAATAY